VQIRYVKLRRNQAWIEKFKNEIRSSDVDLNILIPEERQAELAKLYGLQNSFFRQYGRIEPVQTMIKEIRKLPKNVVESGNGWIAEMNLLSK